MYNHAPENYNCPICLGVDGVESDATMLKIEDLIYRDPMVSVFVNSKFVKNNPGHLIIVPNEHFENVYTLPDGLAARIMSVARQLAVALKEVRKCDGVTLLQNNEPASNQHAFHYHLHVYPRFENDDWTNFVYNTEVSTPEQRKPYIHGLLQYFTTNPIK